MTHPRTPSAATAYLVSQYPALSHEFVAREVRALRSRGVHVRTFSVRPAAAHHIRTDADRAEWTSTTALLGSKGDILKAQARLLVRRPTAWVRGLSTALRSGPRAPRTRLWQLFYFAEAALLAERMRHDGLHHVHVHFANNSADVARIAVAIGSALDEKPWSWSLAMHGPTEFEDVVGHDLAAKVRSASFVACISEYCRGQLKALVEPAHWTKLHIVRMSVDPGRYPSMLDARAGRPSGPLRVLFVGRLVPEKAPGILLEALAQLPAGTIQARIVGAGPLHDLLATRILELGLQDSVTLVGPLGQDELPAEYAWADVFCLPSYAEGLPVVLMEAMSTGLPVVTTTITAIPELVEDGVSGSLVPPGRAELVADALAELARDADLRIEQGRRAQAAVRGLHDPDVNARLLQRLLDGTSPPDTAAPEHTLDHRAAGAVS